ncbi:MAG: fused MFS/spermidine synthase [Cyanobacteria bacterium]|nr:fused MFS/spermidine synthase [Cyanobacteriota bacterium]
MALLAFYLSGFAAVLYQVIWQRLLTFFSGADIYSITIIVAAFMAGLGLGNVAGGRLADRLGPRSSLTAFAIAEISIGVFGLLSRFLFYDVLYSRLPQLGENAVVATLVLFASLLIPTFLMGVSLPLLSRALTHHVAEAGRIIGSLYGWNTLGAATGAFATTWILVPNIGLQGALLCGAAANMLCAMGAVAISRKDNAIEATSTPADAPDDVSSIELTALPFTSWILIYALTGLIALGFEIAWFRLLGAVQKSTAFTFGTVLAVYLAGLGLGGAIGSRFVHRSRAPGRTFLLLQFALTWYAAISIAISISAIGRGVPVRLVTYLSEYEPYYVYGAVLALKNGEFASLGGFFLLYLGIPALIVGPPTLLMGFSFPFLQRACQSNLQLLGRRVGALLSANITGSVIGTTITGWWLLPEFGTASTLRILVIMGALLAIPLWQISRGASRILLTAGALAITAIVSSSVPDGATLWARLHGAAPYTVIAAEDGSGVSVLKPSTTSRDTAVFVNGIGQSWIPYGGIHTVLGALPALLHPDPKNIIIIGLGSGDTAFAAAGRAETSRVTCVEIIGAQLTTLRRQAEIQPYPGLTRVLTDTRIEHVTGDGRAYVLRSEPRFDIIEMDALRPTSAYAGNLYSQEYFDLLRRRLKPGGYAVTWAPTPRIRDTFVSVFPHALLFGDILVGSAEPIAFDPNVIRERIGAVRDYYSEAGIDIMGLVAPYLAAEPRRFGPGDARRMTDLNTDLFPRDEFSLPE